MRKPFVNLGVRLLIVVIAGIVLIVAAGVWKFGLSRTWTQRISPGWSWVSNSLTQQANVDPATHKLPDPGNNQANIYDRRIEVVQAKDTPAVAVMLKDTLKTPNYQSAISAPVDPETGGIVQDEFRGMYFVFPRDVQKTTYTIRQTNISGLPMAYEGEEQIEGLQTYIFSYKGALITTKANPPPPAGQIVKCKDDQFQQKIWVEPTTGEMAKTDVGCDAGVYYFDTASQNYLDSITRWHTVTTGDDVLRQIYSIQTSFASLSWLATYIRLFFLFSWLALL